VNRQPKSLILDCREQFHYPQMDILTSLNLDKLTLLDVRTDPTYFLEFLDKMAKPRELTVTSDDFGLVYRWGRVIQTRLGRSVLFRLNDL
jgi:hypothetical protein